MVGAAESGCSILARSASPELRLTAAKVARLVVRVESVESAGCTNGFVAGCRARDVGFDSPDHLARGRMDC